MSKALDRARMHLAQAETRAVETDTLRHVREARQLLDAVEADRREDDGVCPMCGEEHPLGVACEGTSLAPEVDR